MTHRGPPDFNEMAFRIVEAATAEDAVEEPEPAHVTAGRQGGKARGGGPECRTPVRDRAKGRA